jgi:hypothetical protein
MIQIKKNIKRILGVVLTIAGVILTAQFIYNIYWYDFLDLFLSEYLLGTLGVVCLIVGILQFMNIKIKFW